MSSEREQIVRVLKQYPGITAKMDLSENSALVIDLAAQLQAAKAEAEINTLRGVLRNLHDCGECHACYINDCKLRDRIAALTPPKEPEVSHE